MERTLYRVFLGIAAAALFLPASCYPFNLSLKPGHIDFLNLSLGQYTGGYSITYKDGSAAGPFFPGDSILATGKIIKSITTNGVIHLIGRPDTDTITLNVQPGGVLAFREPGGGFIPIGSYAEFQMIGTDPAILSGNYRQEADLDLMGLSWIPVGSYLGNKFTGSFDGNNNGIYNLFVNLFNPGGLFGDIEGGTVEKVHVRSGSVTAEMNAGGIAGYNTGGTVKACSNAAAVSGAFPGGIVGNLNGGEITACYNTGAVSASGSSSDSGGIVGRTHNSSKITACYNTGAVSAPGGSNIGGVVGVLGSGDKITACYNTGAVTRNGGYGGYCGGVVGRLDTGAGAVCNYWVKGVSDAAKGIGEPASDVNAALFGFGEWPDPTFTEWGLGDGSDGERYWKSLGAWNDGNPVYPKLWYEP